MSRTFLGILCAVVLHAAFLLFGGLLLPEAAASHANAQEVELLDEVADDTKKEEPPPEDPPEVETKPEDVPDAAEVIRNLEQPAADATPALDAASLSAIGDALLGQGGGAGDFASALSFASGGRIGGTGKGGALDATMDQAFSLADLDQKPRAAYQAEPIFPKEMRGKKVEGVVSVIFVVDATGKVADPRAEKSTHPAFDKPAIDAVKQWRFEPGVKGGKRVPCKMRVSIRFPNS
ncbi:MAG TPA: TonB family protein [Planctomycetota bacterium]|nr:TonB family protein [Planctomycetota bacterium]